MPTDEEFDFLNIDVDVEVSDKDLFDGYEFDKIEGSEPSLYDRYNKTLEEYQAKFGRTFDDMLVSKCTDDVYEEALELMKQALAGDREAITNKDLGLPEYEEPGDFEPFILY